MNQLDLQKNKYNEIDLEIIVSNNLGTFSCQALCAYQTLSENFIEKHSDILDWPNISRFQILSEPFIERYADKVYCPHICRYQILSEPFIEKHLDTLDWPCISQFQRLSESFIEKYIDVLNVYGVCLNKKISKEFRLNFLKNNKSKIEDLSFVLIRGDLFKEISEEYNSEIDMEWF